MLLNTVLKYYVLILKTALALEKRNVATIIIVYVSLLKLTQYIGLSVQNND